MVHFSEVCCVYVERIYLKCTGNCSKVENLRCSDVLLARFSATLCSIQQYANEKNCIILYAVQRSAVHYDALHPMQFDEVQFNESLCIFLEGKVGVKRV